MDIITVLQKQIEVTAPIMNRIACLRPVPMRSVASSNSLSSGEIRYDKVSVKQIEEDINQWQYSTRAVLAACFPGDNEHKNAFERTIVSPRMFYDAKEELEKEVKEGRNVLSAIIDEVSLRDELHPEPIAKDVANKVEKRPLVFISHANADKDIIKQFIKIILKEGLGLRDENIACTSFEATGVTIGDDIPKYIRDNIASAQVVLAMVSKAYKASEVCQNEVGAAWALSNRPLQILLPDVDFDELGWLLNLKKAGRIDQQDSLDNLEEVLCDRLNIKLESPRHWNPCVNSFLTYLHKDKEPSQEVKEVVFRAYSVRERKGQCVLIIKNDGEATVNNVQIDIENKDEYDGFRPELPVTYDELIPGAERRIILALVEGNNKAKVLFTWYDESQEEHKQEQTIDL